MRLSPILADLRRTMVEDAGSEILRGHGAVPICDSWLGLDGLSATSEPPRGNRGQCVTGIASDESDGGWWCAWWGRPVRALARCRINLVHVIQMAEAERWADDRVSVAMWAGSQRLIDDSGQPCLTRADGIDPQYADGPPAAVFTVTGVGRRRQALGPAMRRSPRRSARLTPIRWSDINARANPRTGEDHAHGRCLSTMSFTSPRFESGVRRGERLSIGADLSWDGGFWT